MAIRLFAACELPEDVAAALSVAVPRSLLRQVNPTAAKNLHITLAFLGARPEEEVEAIAAALERCCAAGAWPVGLEVGEALWLPPRRPGVLALRIEDDGALSDLAERVMDALTALGVYQREFRAFLAHVTIGRVVRGKRVHPVDVPAPAVRAFDVPAVTLFRSQPGRGGVVYEPLTRIMAP